MKRIYLDHAATTPVDKRVLEAMLPFFSDFFGNPSSVHSFSREAKDAVNAARERIAAFIGSEPGEIVFTGGGTESDNMVIKGVVYAGREDKNHIITSKIEHHAVLESCRFMERQGFSVTYLPVDRYGMVDPDRVKEAITDRTILISVMHANNEIGTIQPIREIGRVARERGVYFHTDAVQSLGHIPVNVDDLNVDLLSSSAHKLYGPKGVGMLYIRNGVRLHSFMHGGDQEKGRRASTHNVPGIVGFGKAVELAGQEMEAEMRNLRLLRDYLIKGILEGIVGSSLNGHPEHRLPNNVNVSMPDAEAEYMLTELDRSGIACSAGAACASTSVDPSHVLSAIGVPPETAFSTLRFSLGRSTTGEEIKYVLEVLP
ncbi:MAG: cysteine desulfurase NifS, partial [Deltaproteobacteria bacterium]|nr:cysteine desulfurase NifS [Deltaproteobacteria bacterium]